MKIQPRSFAPLPIRAPISAPAAAAAEPADRVDTGAGTAPAEASAPAAWRPLADEPRVFGSGLTSSLLMACCGPLAVVISKAGEAADKIGQKFGWWDSLGAIGKPLPPSLLGPLPAARMARPMLLVPGFHTPKDRFNHLVDKLTENGANGGRAYYVADGQFFSDIECTNRTTPSGADARVFVAVFPQTNTPPDQSSADLARSLEAIQQFTGQKKVDVTGYSMGGLATRVYLDQGGEAVGKFMMLGTPNQGSALARTSLGLLDLQRWGFDTDWLLERKPLAQVDRQALGWLLPVDGGSKNPQLSDLNQRWKQQKEHTEGVRLVGGGALPTMGRYFIPAFGDGTVTASSLRLGDEETVFLKDRHHRNHGMLFSNPETYLQMRDFFGWS